MWLFYYFDFSCAQDIEILCWCLEGSLLSHGEKVPL